MLKDFYQILGVSESATQEEIKKVYRQKMLEVHPDRNPNPEAQELAKEINEAFSVLGDEEKRRAYDNKKNNPMGGFGNFGFDIDSLFSQFMGRGRPSRGKNVEVSLKVSLFECLFGAKKDVTYSFTTRCEKCKTGCSFCGGTGSQAHTRGHMTITSLCQKCNGSGFFSPGCEECDNGVVTASRTFIVNVPKMIKNGDRLGIAGGGLPGQKNAPYGDLIVVIEIHYPNLDTVTDEEKEVLRTLLSV